MNQTPADHRRDPDTFVAAFEKPTTLVLRPHQTTSPTRLPSGVRTCSHHRIFVNRSLIIHLDGATPQPSISIPVVAVAARTAFLVPPYVFGRFGMTSHVSSADDLVAVVITATWPVPESQGHHWQTPSWCEQVPLLCGLVDQVPSQH